MMSPLRLSAGAAALVLSACATVPTGPTLTALPGSRMSFDQFQSDDFSCRQHALQASGAVPNQVAANDAAVGNAAVGAALGAVVGGLLGGRDGAAVGAGMGLLTGTAVGADQSYAAGAYAQQRYDSAYVQCMYARGHQVPVPAGYARSIRSARYATPAPYYAPPPNAAIPPPNTPPPGTPSSAPPPNAAIPPPNTPPPSTPPPYQQR